jgi:hypothetical protein
MPESKSDEWHEVVHVVYVLQDMLQRHVAEATPVIGTRKIRRHVAAIADELGALYRAAGDKMGKAAEREKKAHA